MKIDTNSYCLAKIDTYFWTHTDKHTDIPNCFIALINCS